MKTTKPASQQSQSLKKALLIANTALDKKALEPVLIDVSGEDTYTDYLLVISARSNRQVRAIADHLVEVLVEQGASPIGEEGRREGRWALVDFGDVVVHIFYHPLRELYDLEGLWVDAPRIPLKVPPEQRIRPHDPEELGYSLSD